MINVYLDTELVNKIKVIDRIFGACDLKQLQAIADSEQIVAKLRGDDNNSGLLLSIITQADMTAGKVDTLQTQIMLLENDIKQLIRTINQSIFTPVIPTIPSAPYEFQNLKNRHGIY